MNAAWETPEAMAERVVTNLDVETIMDDTSEAFADALRERDRQIAERLAAAVEPNATVYPHRARVALMALLADLRGAS